MIVDPAGDAGVDPVAAAACMDSFANTDFRPDLARIEVPTLVLHGDADAIVPLAGSGARTHAAVAGSRLVVLAGAPAPGVLLVLGTGFLGGFTTFSTACVEVVRLVRAGRRRAAAGLALVMLGVSAAAAALGLTVGLLAG